MSPVHVTRLVAVTILGTACAQPGEPGLTTEVVDSAGVRIVNHSSLNGPEWSVSETPSLTLGTVDEEGPESFFRVSAAIRSEDGTITVFNASSADARQFTASGQHLRTIGREGQGPGEFMGVARMRALSGNRLAIWDTRARRLSIFDSEGELEGIVSPEGIERRPQLMAVMDDGSTLFQQEIPIYEPAPVTLRQNYANYIRWNADGTVLDSLPVQEHVEVIKYGESPMAGPPRFGAATTYAGDATGYWIGGQKLEEIARYSLAGDVETIVRWPTMARDVTPEDAEVWLQNRLLEVTDPEMRERVIDLHNDMAVADRFPAYGDFFMDRVGMLWMPEYERPGRTEPSRWWVFDPAGMLRGEVRLPLGYRLFDVGADHIVAGRSDEMGVEFVDVLQLTRSGS